jgi:hypothetical protein
MKDYRPGICSNRQTKDATELPGVDPSGIQKVRPCEEFGYLMDSASTRVFIIVIIINTL